MKWGDKFHPGYVTKIIHEIKSKLKVQNKIYLYTDNADGLERYVDIIPIENFPYNFNRRVNLFRKGFGKGYSIVCDLDMKIIKDFSYLLNEQKGITVIPSHWKKFEDYRFVHTEEHGYRTTINGSITFWRAEDPMVHEIYNHFMSNPEYYSEKYWGAIDRFVEWENLYYNTFPNEIAFSHVLGPHDDNEYCVELFNRGAYQKTLEG